MLLIPAIDLKDGHCVRLQQGDMELATVFSEDPAEMALHWLKQGARRLHLVDLNGAFAGKPKNESAIKSILQIVQEYAEDNGIDEIPVQLGGGIRTPEAVAGWFDLGVSRVVMGTAALKDPQFVKDMAREYPGGIVVAVDARDGMVATEGWAEVSDVSIVDMVRRFEDAGVASLLFTDIGRDGMLKGCNIEATVDLARRTDLPVIASGGVKGLDDIRMLTVHAADGIEGVITGRALYDGRLDLAAAIAMAERD